MSNPVTTDSEPNTGKKKKKNKRKRGKGGEDDENDEKSTSTDKKPKSKPCKHCHLRGHASDECWELEKNKANRPDGWVSRNQRGKQTDTFTRKEAFAIAQEAAKQATKKKRTNKHKKSKATKGDDDDSDTPNDLYMTEMLNEKFRDTNIQDSSDESDNESLQSQQTYEGTSKRRNPECNNNMTMSKRQRCDRAKPATNTVLSPPLPQAEEVRANHPTNEVHEVNRNSRKRSKTISTTEYANPFFNRSDVEFRKAKKAKQTHYSAEIIVEIEDRHGNTVPIRALIDTGTSSSIVLRDFVRKGRAGSYKGKRTKWSTLGGVFSTNRKALIDFKLPELSTDKKVTWIMHVDDKSSPKTALYDMILGMDLLTEIGLFVNTEDKTVCWEGAAVPLKERGELQDAHVTEQLYHMAQEPNILKDAEERQARILESDYSKVDIDDFVDELQHLSRDEQRKLKKCLNEYKQLFGGGLGTLKIKPIHLELNDDAKPYHSRAFPVPKSMEAPTKKEMERLHGIGVFDKNHDSEWASPTFIQPKKTGGVRILTDFRKLNAQLKRKPFPLPKISDLLQKLAGFKYATAIDLSMGYYHIPLDEASQALCTTILPWGKYRYKRLPMGIKNSPDIFQSIMMDLLGDLEYTRSYIDDILVTSSGSFEDHLEKLKGLSVLGGSPGTQVGFHQRSTFARLHGIRPFQGG